MRLSHPVSRATVTGDGEAWPCLCDLCCWPNAKASWCRLLIMTTASSSPLSDAQEEGELVLVSMETTDSESWGHCGEEGFEHDGESEAEEEEEEAEELASLVMASMGSDGLWWPCSMLCSWLLLLIMLFMAFCISRSIRCFSRFGMRPNRTAASEKKFINTKNTTS